MFEGSKAEISCSNYVSALTLLVTPRQWFAVKFELGVQSLRKQMDTSSASIHKGWNVQGIDLLLLTVLSNKAIISLKRGVQKYKHIWNHAKF